MKTKYNGLFVRDTLSDTGMIPSVDGAPTYSPDIICYQTSTLDVTDAAISYNKYICKDFMQDSYNNVYIRVKNNSDTALSGKVKAFYAPITLLYTPKYWTPITDINGNTELSVVSMADGKPQDRVNAGDIGLCKNAFFLDKVEKPNKHHCMMGVVSDDNTGYPTLPEKFDGDNGLWKFLRNNPQIAYNNINIIKPDYHIFSMPVQYGNHDETTRKYILNIDVMEGLDTLAGTQIISQSTSAIKPFTYQETIQPDKFSYACEYTVDGTCYDYMNFSVIMPDYDKVKASLHIRNYAVNESGDIMTPDIALDYAADVADSQTNDLTATQLGDFFLYLGEGLDGVKPVVFYPHISEGLPRLEVTQRF